MCSAIDQLDDFHKYETDILPLLRRAIIENWLSRKIRRELASFSQALIVQKALNGKTVAIKDVLDRHEGKPLRKVNRTHQYAEMTKDELVALVYQKLVEAGIIS